MLRVISLKKLNEKYNLIISCNRKIFKKQKPSASHYSKQLCKNEEIYVRYTRCVHQKSLVIQFEKGRLIIEIIERLHYYPIQLFFSIKLSKI